MRNSIYVVLVLLLFIAGCKTDVTVEVYSSDLQTVKADATAKLTVLTLLAIEIPSSSECDKYTSQIVGIMKDFVPDFKPRECTREGMESFLVGELQSPLLSSMDAWKAADALIGVIISATGSDLKDKVFLTLNRSKFAKLNKKMDDEFHQTLDISKSKVTMVLHNDERTPQTYGIGGALLNGQPIYERSFIEVGARRNVRIQLSDVGSAALVKNGQVILLNLKS